MALGITSITPNSGRTSGWERVTIEGTDFDTHPYPPPAGPVGTPQPWPPVKVKFGLLEAPSENLWVLPKPGGAPGETIIECHTPRYTGDPDALPSPVDVTVENLLNPGSVISVGAYTYQHPDNSRESVPLPCGQIPDPGTPPTGAGDGREHPSPHRL